MIGFIPKTIFENIRNAHALFSYGLLVQLAFVAVLTPLTSYLVKYFVSLSGYATINNKAIAEFVLSPVGLLAIWLVFGLSVAFFLAEQAGMQIIVAAKQKNDQIRFRHCLLLLGRSFPTLVRLGLYQFLMLFLLAIPFVLLAGLTYWILLSKYDINFYLENQPREYWIAISIGALLVFVYAILAFRLIIRWLFCIPIIVFEKKNVRHSISHSRQQVRPRLFRVIVIVLSWILLNLAIAFAISRILEWINGGILNVWSGYDNIAIVMTAMLLLMEFMVGLLLNLFFLGGLAGLAIRLFRESDGDIDPAILDRLTSSESKPEKKFRILGLSATSL